MRFNEIYGAVVLERNTGRAKDIKAKVRDEWKLEGTNCNRRRRVSEEDQDEEEERRKGEEAFVPRNGFTN